MTGAGVGASLAPEKLEREIRSNHFAVLATQSADGTADSAGVSYGATRTRDNIVLYVMTRSHLRKARDIAREPNVSLVIPIPRRMLWFVPPATIQLQGSAELLPRDDPVGTAVFRSFYLGRRILAGYRRMYARGERRVCFVKITAEPVVRTYMVGASIWQVMRRMESGAATTRLV
jgi:hypothetical protein